MDVKKLLLELDSVLDTRRSGVLSTIDDKGYPRSRWMTPALIPGQDGRVYCLASPDSIKVKQLDKNSRVNWMFTSAKSDRVISVQGKARVLENPDLAATVVEAIGGNLEFFWKSNDDPSNLIIIETLVEEIELYRPADGTHTKAQV